MSTDDPVAPTNAGMRDAWDGATGAFWAEHADRFDAAVAAYRAPFLDAAAFTAGDVVLDVGCGAGQLTVDAARVAHSVLGVDLSARLLEVARTRTESLANVAFRQADAQVHPFGEAAFDAVVSRHGTMFFGDPVAAFAHLHAATRPGGRLVLLTWQGVEHQEWMRTFLTVLAAGRKVELPPADRPGPLALSDPDRIHAVLADAGYADVTLDDLRAPMVFGAHPDEALTYITGQQAGMLADLDDEARAGAVAALRADLAAHHTDGGVRYGSASWLVRARRR